MPDRDPGVGLLDRLPHSGPARLPGRVVSFEPPARVAAERSLATGDPCLNEAGLLPSFLLVELMAQVGGLLIDDAGAGPGDRALLAGIKRMHIHATAGAGETVLTECALARRMGDLYLIECRSRSGGRELAHGFIQIRRLRKKAG